MKNKLFNLMAIFFVASLTFCFTACGGDDDENGSSSLEKTLIGQWKIVDGDYWAKQRIGQIFIFNEDHTADWGYGETYEWSLDGNKLTRKILTGERSGKLEYYTIKIEGNLLYLYFKDPDSSSSEADEYTILEKIVE